MNNESEIQGLYIRYFGRPADYQGVEFWSSLASRGVSISDIKVGFESSPEFLRLYASLSATAIVERAYDYLFGRKPDVAGLSFWSLHLQTGALTLKNILDTIVKSAVADDKLTYEARIAAASNFTQALRRTNTPYTDLFVHETGRSWLRQINQDAPSQRLAAEQISDLVTRLNGKEAALIDQSISAGMKSMIKSLGSSPILRIYYDARGNGITRLAKPFAPMAINDTIIGALRLAFSRVDSLAPSFRLVETTDLSRADIEVHVVQSLDGNTSGLTTSSIRTDLSTGNQRVYSRIDLVEAQGIDVQYLASHEILHAFGGEHPFENSDGDSMTSFDTADTLLAYQQSTFARDAGYATILTPLDEALLRYLYS